MKFTRISTYEEFNLHCFKLCKDAIEQYRWQEETARYGLRGLCIPSYQWFTLPEQESKHDPFHESESKVHLVEQESKHD